MANEPPRPTADNESDDDDLPSLGSEIQDDLPVTLGSAAPAEDGGSRNVRQRIDEVEDRIARFPAIELRAPAAPERRNSIEEPSPEELAESQGATSRNRSRSPRGSADAYHARRVERKVFIANRVETPASGDWLRKKQTKYKSTKAKEDSGKLLVFAKSSLDVQQGLLQSRKEEWKKWMDFDAGELIMGEQLDRLLSEGYTPIPTQ